MQRKLLLAALLAGLWMAGPAQAAEAASSGEELSLFGKLPRRCVSLSDWDGRLLALGLLIAGALSVGLMQRPGRDGALAMRVLLEGLLSKSVGGVGLFFGWRLAAGIFPEHGWRTGLLLQVVEAALAGAVVALLLHGSDAEHDEARRSQ